MSKTPKQTYTYEYPRPAVTVDVVIVSRDAPRKVLLIQRKHEPFAGQYALPGGFVDMDEGLEDAARRELLEETGVRVAKVEQLSTFGEPGRDPRGRTISVAFLAEVDLSKVKPVGGDDAASAGWHSLTRPPALAFDHAAILATARKRLKATRPFSRRR